MPNPTKQKKSTRHTESRPVVIAPKLQEPDALTPMNFRVPAQFHREFKLYAVQHGISMVDLLRESFRIFKEHRAE